jgi:hypothetical protein
MFIVKCYSLSLKRAIQVPAWFSLSRRNKRGHHNRKPSLGHFHGLKYASNTIIKTSKINLPVQNSTCKKKKRKATWYYIRHNLMLIGTFVSLKSLAGLALYKGFPRIKTTLQTSVSCKWGWWCKESIIY